MSYHKVMVHIESYIENVKCLVKHKTKGYSVEYKASCLVKDSPAKKVTYDPGWETRHPRDTSRKRVHAGVTQSPKVSSSFQKPPGMNLRDWVMSHQEHEDMGTKPLIPTHRLTDCKQKLRALLAALVSHLGFTQ